MLSFGLVNAEDISTHWAAAEIGEVRAQGIMTGGGDGFLPDKSITRAEFVCAVIRAVGQKPDTYGNGFADVARDSVYAPYINKAVELGLVTGFEDGTFRPESSITREEAAVVLSRAFGFLSGYTLGRSFTDYSQLTEGAKAAVGYALKEKIIAGYPDNTLRPRGTLTRAEAACLILRSKAIPKTTPGFMIGYPRLKAEGVYGNITLEASTNMPCSIYYMLTKGDMIGVPAQTMVTTPLLKVQTANKRFTANIKCDIGEAYNVALMAVTPDGKRSNVVVLENITPLPFEKGRGTVREPYELATVEELDLMRFFPDRAFVLKKDIELSGEWEAISEFYGHLDGDGHRIDGLYINTDKSHQGLFGKIVKGEVKNLLVSGNVRGRSNVGIFAGELLDAKITACVAEGRVEAITNNAGGFFGENSGIIENSLSSVYVVEATAFAGGITGQNYGIIRDTISAAHTVTANMYAGGVASVNMSGGRIERSVAANINVYDMMLDNCGRIAANRSEAVLEGNYAYSGMRTNSENAENETYNNNGGDISWDTLTDRQELVGILGWDKSEWTGGGRGESYLLPHPSQGAMPRLKAGISEYAPIRIERASELLGMIDNPDMHYLLVRDLSFNDTLRWSVAADTLLAEEGFSGTFDGNGHTIRGMKIQRSANGLCGLFGMLSGGEVRNLHLNGTALIGGDIMGAIAAISYGNIIGCTVENLAVSAEGADAYIGGICGYNYANVLNCDVKSNIESDVKNTVVGGVMAHNEGFVNNVSFEGSVRTLRRSGLAESVVGGICGYNSNGMIYNASAKADISQAATTVYSGGICAIQNGGELYKCSSEGSISCSGTELASVSYAGGICGLSAEGIVMHTYSNTDISQQTAGCYGGGISGYNEKAVIQCCYGGSDISQTNAVTGFAGGIAGYNELGVISSVVAVNRNILSEGTTGRICGGGAEDSIYSAYAVKMAIPAVGEGALGGSEISEAMLGYAFFTKPVSEGGKLGWSEEIWRDNGKLPLLRD